MRGRRRAGRRRSAARASPTPGPTSRRLRRCARPAHSSGATSRSRAPPRWRIWTGWYRRRARTRSRAPAARPRCRGRLELISRRPPTILDGAHNPAAVDALSSRCRKSWAQGRWRWCSACSRTRMPPRCSPRCYPLCERAWFTAPPGSRALPPAALQSHARQLGFEAVECEPRPAARGRASTGLGAAGRHRRAGHRVGLSRRRSAGRTGRRAAGRLRQPGRSVAG